MSELNKSPDTKAWFRYWMDTPICPPASAEQREALMPGTYVQSDELGLCGRVSQNSVDHCVVIGHGWETTENERFLWTGTRAEFLATWKID